MQDEKRKKAREEANRLAVHVFGRTVETKPNFEGDHVISFNVRCVEAHIMVDMAQNRIYALEGEADADGADVELVEEKWISGA